MREVAIVQRRLPHYRVPLFESMRAELASHGLRLRLLHGMPTAEEALKKDSGSLDWAEPLSTRYFAQGKLMWQPFTQATETSDLVIVTQENKHLNNLWPLLNPWRRQKLAFWGHGRNMQSARPNGAGERFKRWTTRRVDWWFAYTELSAKFVREDGFSAERITVLNNSIDTGALQASVADAKAIPRDTLRMQLGLATNGPVGLFMGSLYADKRIDFLISAAVLIRQRVPTFQLLLAGDGPQRDIVERATVSHPWIRWVGAVRGTEKAACLAAADLMLNPGLVGLGILDAFVGGLPLLTTDCGLHSPEIAYLADGVNGQKCADRVEAFVDSVVDLFANKMALQAMQTAAQASAPHYSVSAMSERFCSGIRAALLA